MPEKPDESKGTEFRSIYDDTTFFIDNIIDEYDVYPTIIEKMRSGNATMELRKRYFLRAIDETWVNAIEEVLPALDQIIRNPSKFIEEKEELIPVELARKVTVRTLQHLAQHTNYIQSIKGDEITPSMLLNVYKDETLQTYENKFINTLINRLYMFVNRRYEIALKAGQDEKTTSIDFNEDFAHDKIKVKVNFKIEISEPSNGLGDKVERNYSYTTDLWHRVEKLNSIVTAYAGSEFCTEMGHSFIRPPVMRTNAILKNKNLRQCYELWQFIEGYDSAGYSMLLQESLEKIDEGYIKEMYSTLAIQYMLFRYNIRNEFDFESTLDSSISDEELRPHIVSELSKTSEHEFDVKETPFQPEKIAKTPAEVRYATLTPEDQIILESLDVALEADRIITERDEAYLYSRGDIPEPEPVPDNSPKVEEPEEPEETEGSEPETPASVDEPASETDSTGENNEENNESESAAEVDTADNAVSEDNTTESADTEDKAEEESSDTDTGDTDTNTEEQSDTQEQTEKSEEKPEEDTASEPEEDSAYESAVKEEKKELDFDEIIRQMYERIDYANAAIKPTKKSGFFDSPSASEKTQTGQSEKPHDDFLSDLKFPFEDQPEDTPDNDGTK